MTCPSSVICDYLIETAALFTIPSDGDSWPIYDGAMPDGNETPNQCAAVLNTAGVMEGKDMLGNLDQRYGVQIRIRGMSESTTYEKTKEVEDAFKGVTYQDVTVVSGETWRIYNLQQTTPIMLVSVDDRRRFTQVINFLCCMKTI